jgi:hypothetical protein
VFVSCTCALGRAFDCTTRCVCVSCTRAHAFRMQSRTFFAHPQAHTMAYTSLSACMQSAGASGRGNPRLGSRHNVTICQLALSKSICDTRLQEESERRNISPRVRSAADMSHRCYQAAAAAPRQHQILCPGLDYGSGSTGAMSRLLHSFHAAGLTVRGADSPAESSTGSCTWLASAASLLARARKRRPVQIACTR